MLNRRSLDPEKRTLYGANLQPPAGYVFDAAVATTYSFDLETALAVPGSLALFAAENHDDILSHPFALIEMAWTKPLWSGGYSHRRAVTCHPWVPRS